MEKLLNFKNWETVNEEMLYSELKSALREKVEVSEYVRYTRKTDAAIDFLRKAVDTLEKKIEKLEQETKLK